MHAADLKKNGKKLSLVNLSPDYRLSNQSECWSFISLECYVATLEKEHFPWHKWIYFSAVFLYKGHIWGLVLFFTLVYFSCKYCFYILKGIISRRWTSTIFYPALCLFCFKIFKIFRKYSIDNIRIKHSLDKLIYTSINHFVWNQTSLSIWTFAKPAGFWHRK